MKLSRKLTWFLELGILLLVVIYAYSEITDDERTIRADVTSDMTSVARESVALLSTLDADTARATLDRALDPNASIQVRWVPAAPGEPLAEHVIETKHTLAVRRGFSDPAGHPAMLEVSRSTDDIDRLVRYDAIRTILLIAVVIALGTLYSVFIGSRIIARPVRKLVAAFRRVGEGDLTPIGGTRSRDEFDVLANELDVMIRQLADTRGSLVREHTARIAAIEQLQHAERLTTVGKLASGVAHELGTPLNVISGYARLIATGQETGAAAADSARIIDEQTQRITKIIRQLLDFARHGKPRLAAVDLRGTVASGLQLAGVLARKAGVSLDYRQPSEPMIAMVDAGRIEQVIVNLVHNAIQESVSGSEVAVRIARANGDIRIDVRDHGHGIAPEHLHRVFEPFFTTKEVGAGTGLGLSVSHGILEEHGGHIVVASKLGEGAEFSVFLPAHVEAAA